VILAALAVGKDALPDYSHPCSPKVFTQPQLFACLALMVFLRSDYRGIEAYLRDFTAIGEWLGLSRVPDHSTLHKAAQRFFGAAISDRLLASSLRLLMKRHKLVQRMAADSTGLESGHRSPYFVRRRQRGATRTKNPFYQTTSYTRFPKLTLLIDCDTHAALALLTGRGPRPDINELARLLQRLPPGITPQRLLADAGFDCESNHVLAREIYGIRSLMPATHGRPCKNGKLPTGRWRRRMSRWLRTKRQRRRCGYTQRWQIETVVSMIKRNLGDALSSAAYGSQCRELRRLVIVHNIMILIFNGRVFDGAILTPFLIQRKAAGVAGRGAGRSAGAVADVRKSCGDGCGAGGVAAERAARRTVRKADVDNADRRAPGAGSEPPPARAAAEGDEKVECPLFRSDDGCIGVTCLNLGKDSPPDFTNCFRSLPEAKKQQDKMKKEKKCPGSGNDDNCNIFSVKYYDPKNRTKAGPDGRVNVQDWWDNGVNLNDWHKPADKDHPKRVGYNFDFGWYQDGSGGGAGGGSGDTWTHADHKHDPGGEYGPMTVIISSQKEWDKKLWDFDQKAYCVACGGGGYGK
jgi:hypothetical protein